MPPGMYSMELLVANRYRKYVIVQDQDTCTVREVGDVCI